MEMETLSGMMTLTRMKGLKILALTLMLKKRDTTHSGNTAVQKKPEAVQTQVSTGLCQSDANQTKTEEQNYQMTNQKQMLTFFAGDCDQKCNRNVQNRIRFFSSDVGFYYKWDENSDGYPKTRFGH